MKSTQEKVRDIIEEELGRAKIDAKWDMREIHVLPNSKCVIEHTSSTGTLSEALICHHFPQIENEQEVAHYTSLDSFQNIIKSGELWLFPILKRIKEQEFRPFSEAHGLNGYLDQGSNCEPYYVSLMKDLYYTSFTSTNLADEKYMWNVFGDGGTGVKIVFKISVIKKRADFRPVLYHSKAKDSSTIIKKLSDRILNECDRHFILRGISRIGAFYLPLGFQLEKEEETRLLVKSWGDGPAYDKIVYDKPYPYIPLEIGEGKNKFCKIIISEIHAGDKCDMTIVQESLQKSDFKSVPFY